MMKDDKIFVKMYTELEFLSQAYNFDVLKTNTYPDWVWKSISRKFTKDQWEEFLIKRECSMIKMRNDFEKGVNKVLDVLSIELLNRKTTKFDEFASRFVKKVQSIKPAKGFEPNFETGIDVAFEVMANIATDMEPSGSGDTWKLVLSIMKQVKHL